MADQKISELTALTGANVADDDAIAIVDTSATETKKIVFSELKNALDSATGFVRITGDTMTGALDVQSTITADGLTVAGDAIVQTGAGTLTVDAFGGGSVQVSSNGAYKHISTLSSGYHLFEVNSKSVAKFNNSGDISFYEDTGTTAKFFWDASAESLGIGTSSPATALDLSGGTKNQVAIFRSSDATATIGFADNSTPLTANLSYVTMGAIGSSMVFNTNLNERMRISADGSCRWTPDGSNPDMTLDASGNLLVGTTTILAAESNVEGISLAAGSYGGLLSVSRDSNRAATFNRKTLDGDIVEFRKDGAPVGSIGTDASDLTIGTGAAGIRFLDGDPSLAPHNMTTNDANDSAIDIGRSSRRFKDLYLSGGVYLGGTDAANKLDDYEIGSFTPVVADAASGGNEATTLRSYGYYTKIGRWVNIVIELTNIDTTGLTGTNNLRITGLPFAADSVTGAVAWQGAIQVASVDLSAVVPYIIPTISENADTILIREWGDNTGTDSLLINQLTSGSADINITMGYQV